jgi:hypothetical protein
MRFFKVQEVKKPGQKANNGSEKNTNGHSLVFSGMQPVQAAKKAMNELCKRKTHKGICALRIKLIEVESSHGNGKGAKMKNGDVVPMMYKSKDEIKSFSYRLQKRLLKNPVTLILGGKEVVYKYDIKITSELNKK